MSHIRDAIENVIRGDLALRLKEAGYKKAARTFFAERADHTRVVNVQSDKWNQGSHGGFTINLGVYLPQVALITEALPLSGLYPKEYECSVQVRLGALMHEGQDVWWKIEAGTDVPKLAAEVGKAWAAFGQPWLERVSTLEGAHAELLSQYAYYHAAATALLLGRRDEARALVERALERLPRAAKKLSEWGQKHGLLQVAV